MKKKQTFIVVLLNIGLFILLGYTLGGYASSSLFTEKPNKLCAVTMTKIIASAQGDVYNLEGATEFVEPESFYLAAYTVQEDSITNPIFESVPGDLKDEQKDTQLQNEAWKIFTDLIPARDRQMVAQYNVFTDGFENTLAAVDQTTEDPAQWVLEIDIADLSDKDMLMFTIIHEYAHLLTLNASQVTPDQEIVDDPYNLTLQEQKAAACPYYFTGGGCSLPNSYMNAFYIRFWGDINEEWEKVDALQYGTENLTPYYAGLYDFYQAHRDQFLDDYSTTHPAEDIAEAFTYFVFSAKPTGSSIKEQKVAFFYEYPELIQLRESIINGACSAE